MELLPPALANILQLVKTYSNDVPVSLYCPALIGEILAHCCICGEICLFSILPSVSKLLLFNRCDNATKELNQYVYTAMVWK